MATAQRRIKVLVVDDHRTFAEAVAIALGLERDLSAKIASSGAEALAMAEDMRPDVVLMDLEMPGIGGLAAIRLLRSARPEARVIVLSGHDEDLQKAAALEAGATGYLSKSTTLAKIAEAVRQARAGEALVAAEEMGRLLRQLRHRRHQESTERQRVNRLTPRQVQIIQLIADGATPRDIAVRLGVSPLTLRTHVQNVLTRLAVHTKLEAVAMCVKHGKVSVSAVGRLSAVDR